MSGGKATITLPALGHRYTIKENLIGENVGKGGSYRIEMDAKLTELIKVEGFDGDVSKQTAQILMYQDGNSGLKSENYVSLPVSLELGAEAVTLSADFDYNSTLSNVPRSAALQFVADEGQVTDGALNYYPKFEISEIRLVEVSAPQESAPVPVREYWKLLNTVDFEDCGSDAEVAKYYPDGVGSITYLDGGVDRKYVQIFVNNPANWKKYGIRQKGSLYFTTSSEHSELKEGTKVRFSVKVKVGGATPADTVVVYPAILSTASSKKIIYSGEKTTVNKNEWTTLEYEFDYSTELNGFSCVAISDDTGVRLLHDDYKTEVLVEEDDYTFTFNNKPVARIFSESLVGSVAGVGEKTYPYVAKISADEIGGNGKVIFATYVGNLLSKIEIKDVSDAVDGFVTHSINIDKIDNAEINIICLDNLNDINYLCDYKGIKAE